MLKKASWNKYILEEVYEIWRYCLHPMKELIENKLKLLFLIVKHVLEKILFVGIYTQKPIHQAI